MRLILTIRGTNVIDLELCWPGKPTEKDDGPRLEASGGGQAERADPYGDPACTTTFGFRHTAGG